MRALILLLLLGPNALSAAKLRVIVHTREQLVRERVMDCNGPHHPPQLLERTIVASGWYSWHAVGGDAPYALIHEAACENGSVFITVRDSKGRIAMGTGTIRTVISLEYLECPDAPMPAPPSTIVTAKKAVRPPSFTRPPIKPDPFRRERTDPVDRGGGTTVKREGKGDLPKRPTSAVRTSGR